MFKVRIKFEKNEYSAYISHLDLMNTLQRSLVRAKLPVRYTEGFNPHIYLSILVPLSTGYQSQCELSPDFDLTTDTLPEDLESRLNWGFAPRPAGAGSGTGLPPGEPDRILRL